MKVTTRRQKTIGRALAESFLSRESAVRSLSLGRLASPAGSRSWHRGGRPGMRQPSQLPPQIDPGLFGRRRSYSPIEGLSRDARRRAAFRSKPNASKTRRRSLHRHQHLTILLRRHQHLTILQRRVANSAANVRATMLLFALPSASRSRSRSCVAKLR